MPELPYHIVMPAQAVMFLDTDLGQPELTPPGLVSITRLTAPLLGPPCTHMRTPDAAYYVVNMMLLACGCGVGDLTCSCAGVKRMG